MKRYDKLKSEQRRYLKELWQEQIFEYWDLHHNIPNRSAFSMMKCSVLEIFSQDTGIDLRDEIMLNNLLFDWIRDLINKRLEENNRLYKIEKTEAYAEIIPQVQKMVEGVGNVVGVLANVSSMLNNAFYYYYWTGFYIVNGERLELGPFQGDPACYFIRYGKGVCGKAWEEKQTVIVPNIHKFPGHIACSSKSNSEIVVPVIKDGEVKAVIDIDSTSYKAFGEADKEGLEKIAEIISPLFT